MKEKLSDEYSLVYYRKSDRKKYLARRVANNNYVFYDEETGEKFSITLWNIYKEYEKDKANKFAPKRRNFRFKKRLSDVETVA